MNNEQIDIIKIGGSIITDKGNYRTLRKDQLSLLSKELAKWDRNCIIVHGAGSFGHTIANQYSIHKGFTDLGQLEGLLQIRKDMLDLAEIVTSTLIQNGMKAISFQTSAIVYEKKDESYSFYFDPVKKALSLDLCPVLSGDILFSEDKGFRIYSGDALINLIVQNFNVARVIFISDVDGLYLKDAETQENKLVDFITSKDFEIADISKLEQKDSNDVTGGMKGKISAIISILDYVSKVVLVNGFHPERLALIREGEKFIGTSILNENST